MKTFESIKILGLSGEFSQASLAKMYTHSTFSGQNLRQMDENSLIFQKFPQPSLNMGPDPEDDRHEGSGLALEEAKPKLKPPPMYKVVLLNDDYTPMEFVVEVLEIFFRMDRQLATHVMLTVHTQGKGICGVFTKDIAETKAAQVNQYARDHEHPLLADIEISDD